MVKPLSCSRSKARGFEDGASTGDEALLVDEKSVSGFGAMNNA
jgi:hypothetical protein